MPQMNALFFDPIVSKGGGVCEACGKRVSIFSTGGIFGDHEATGGIFNCNLGEPADKLPCRHIVCYSCVPKIQEGRVKLHVPGGSS